jgi:predicted nucleic acid-binding protein
MRRGLKDGLVKATQDGLNAPFEQFYLDSWVLIPYFEWKIRNGNEPQVIDYLKRTIVKKIISKLVKIEVSNKIKEKLGVDITEDMWEDCFGYLKLDYIGNPLNLSPTTPEEFDGAHLSTAKSLDNCVIITGDKKLIEKSPEIVWFYGKVRQVQSDG